MTRLIALLLVLCFGLGAVSCSVVSRKEQSLTVEKQTLPSADPDAQEKKTEIYVLVNGEKITPDYVLELDGEKIGYTEFRYNYLLEKENILMNLSVEEAASYWTEENEKKLLDTVIETIRNEHSYLNYAAENRIVLSEEEQKNITASIENAKKAYGEESLLKQLQSMYIPDYDFYRVMVERSTLTQSAIPDFLYGENGQRVWDDAKLDEYVRNKFQCTMREYYDTNYLRAKHILIQFVSGESKDDCTETLKKINDVYEKLQNGADFDQCITTYNEDPGMASQPDGYVFAEGTMVDEFYKGTLALEMNSYSQPVQTSYGFHIILRLPLTDEGLNTAKEEMLFGSRKLTGAYKEDLTAFSKEISDNYKPEVKINPILEGHINHDSIF